MRLPLPLSAWSASRPEPSRGGAASFLQPAGCSSIPPEREVGIALPAYRNRLPGFVMTFRRAPDRSVCWHARRRIPTRHGPDWQNSRLDDGRGTWRPAGAGGHAPGRRQHRSRTPSDRASHPQPHRWRDPPRRPGRPIPRPAARRASGTGRQGRRLPHHRRPDLRLVPTRNCCTACSTSTGWTRRAADFARMPVSSGSSSSSGLPVRVALHELHIGRLQIGAAVAGQSFLLSASGSAALDSMTDRAGQADRPPAGWRR